MKRFICYRTEPPAGYVEQGFARPADKPQFEGVVWSDGTVSLRWLTMSGSFANWPSIADVLAIHGHPEYGTRIEWLDEHGSAASHAIHDDDEQCEWCNPQPVTDVCR